MDKQKQHRAAERRLNPLRSNLLESCRTLCYHVCVKGQSFPLSLLIWLLVAGCAREAVQVKQPPVRSGLHDPSYLGPYFFFITGSVRNPGPYLWTNGVTVCDAIQQAGGFTDLPRRTLQLVHRNGAVETFRLNSHQLKTNSIVQPGDRVHSPWVCW